MYEDEPLYDNAEELKQNIDIVNINAKVNDTAFNNTFLIKSMSPFWSLILKFRMIIGYLKTLF